MAESIKEICPNNDILLCRVSADTFVWLYNYTRAVARCINPFEQYQANYLTRSDISLEYHVGRYRIPQGYADVDDIYEKTNYVHSFAKKTSKKNSVIDYDEDVQRIRKNNRLIESKMEKALNNHDFKVYLQPKYTCDGTSIAGAEALVRWIDPEAGAMIFPGDFVPLFEQNGFVVRLDLYMFEETCKIIADWKARGLPIVPVSVNFSRLHFLGDGLADALAEIVKRYGVEPEHLEVEITENALSSNHENISRVITRLRELGFKLSMDDFSSQHSSMSFLAYVDFDVVKLDRAFVEPIADNNRCRLLVSGVIDALKKLEISVVAEGIETQAQVVELTRMNCDMIQGYVFARPLPVDEFNELLALSGTTEMH